MKLKIKEEIKWCFINKIKKISCLVDGARDFFYPILKKITLIILTDY